MCIACAVDGHNWIYPVAVGVIDSETNENWVWFMERLKEAIGTPVGLTFSTDCGQAGRRKNRMKSALEGGSSRKKRHECPICHELWHRRFTCRNGNPEDIAAMEAAK